ncbi:MAG: sensor histidine kinase [Lewinellaceae bacterium]|nr:sensor histidine kinase [Lewinellaceae bacterium]
MNRSTTHTNIPLHLLWYGVLLTGFFPCRSAAQLADSILNLLPQKDELEQVALINQHFYTIMSGDFERAVEVGEQALDISRKLDRPDLEALTLKNLGVAHYLRGNYEKALACYHDALDRYEHVGDPAGEGITLKEMGNYFKKIGRHEKALEELAKAVRKCEAARDTDCLSQALDITGVTLLELNRLEEAEAVFKREIALISRPGYETNLSYALDNLGAVATERGQYELAVGYIGQSRDIRHRLGDEHGVAININNMGEVMLRAGRYDEALPYFEAALEKSGVIGFTDLRRHIMQMLSDAYTGLQRHDKAVEWLKRSYALKDSLFNEERNRQLVEMTTRFETAKKEQALVAQKLELQRRNTWLYLVCAAMALLAAIFTFIYQQQRQKQAQLLRESALKEEIAGKELANRLQDERLRISRDLHDNLGAELTLIGSALARRSFQSGDPVEKSELDSIAGNARQAMGQLRETIWAIRSDGLSAESLVDKIREFANRNEGGPEVAIEFLGDPDRRLTPAQTLNVYRIAQEGITNALKHGNASFINLLLEITSAGRLRMEIRDNGTGIPADHAGQGYGLANMQERAAELQGSIHLENRLEGGSVLRLEV